MRQEYEIELKDFQNEYLGEIVDKYDLPELGKALRCLVDYAIDNPDLEVEIFQLMRCHSCD
ncbi:MAG: hypothetical protein AAF515_05790 [Pseudomonadota bacterium]